MLAPSLVFHESLNQTTSKLLVRKELILAEPDLGYKCQSAVNELKVRFLFTLQLRDTFMCCWLSVWSTILCV